MIYHGDYSLDDLAVVVGWCTDALRPKRRDFDSIVVCGMSGVVVGSPVALATGKPLVIVRKDGDKHHGMNSAVNFDRIGERWIWLDDFVSTGDTFRNLRSRVTVKAQDLKMQPAYVGYCLYRFHECGISERPEGERPCFSRDNAGRFRSSVYRKPRSYEAGCVNYSQGIYPPGWES